MRRLGNDRDLFLLKKKKKNIGAWTKKSFRIEKNFDLCKTTPAPSLEPPLGESKTLVLFYNMQDSNLLIVGCLTTRQFIGWQEFALSAR